MNSSIVGQTPWSARDASSRTPSRLDDLDRVSLCDALDRVLNKGAVVSGEVTISVAGVDLVYLGLELILTSVETARANGCGGVGLKLAIGESDG